MSRKKPGYILHADSDWIDFHLENSVGSKIGYCRGLQAPMKILEPGGKLFFIRSKEKVKKIYFWADFDSDEVISANLAWEIYGSTIGVDNIIDCQHLFDRLPFVQSSGELRVIGGRNMFAPPKPVPLVEAKVEVKKFATKGWSINADELNKIIFHGTQFFKERPAISYASAELRIVIETEAISVVTNHFEQRGWEVVSVETENVGYDLLCTKGNVKLHVEVKGTSSNLEKFILTRNEFNQLKTDPAFVLCLVSDTLNTQSLSIFSGQEVMELFNIDPLQYQVWRKQ